MQNVTLDRLFRAVIPFELASQEFTARALSGSERDERSLYATNEARLLEKALKDKESAEYQFHLGYYDHLDESALREFLVLVRRGYLYREAGDKFKLIRHEFPEKATEEEKRDVLNRREEAEAKHNSDIEAWVDKGMEKYQAEVDALPMDEVLSTSQKLARERVLSARANEAYAHYSIWKSIEQDGKPYFRTIDEARDVGKEVGLQLYVKVQEVDNIDPLKLNGSS